MEDDPIEIPGSFRGFDRDREITISRNNLPHWRQEGATYFITFRLADALPQSALRDFEIERQNFRSMIEREKLDGEPLRKAIETFAKQYGQRFDDYLDKGIGGCILKDPENSNIVATSLLNFDGDRYQLYAAVVMPNHCHLLLRPFEGRPLEDLLESWKGFTARQINKRLGRQGTLWQSESFDRIVRDEEHFCRVTRYIRNNPNKAKLSPNDFRLLPSPPRRWGFLAPSERLTIAKPGLTTQRGGHPHPRSETAEPSGSWTIPDPLPPI